MPWRSVWNPGHDSVLFMRTPRQCGGALRGYTAACTGKEMMVTNKFAAAAAILMLGVSGAALAQTNPAATQTIRADQIRASKLIGTDVFDRYNQSIGSIQDVILDKGGKIDQV